MPKACLVTNRGKSADPKHLDLEVKDNMPERKHMGKRKERFGDCQPDVVAAALLAGPAAGLCPSTVVAPPPCWGAVADSAMSCSKSTYPMHFGPGRTMSRLPLLDLRRCFYAFDIPYKLVSLKKTCKFRGR